MSKKPHSKPATKHFLDTSVARPLVVGTKPYKEYFASTLGGENLYVSRFVQMEFRRSFITNIVNFYFVLDMPSIDTIEDALTFWSHRYKASELKAVISFTGKLFNAEKLDATDPKDKAKALLSIGRILRRLQAKFSLFADTGIDSTRCARAAVSLDINLASLTRDLRDFIENFNDVHTCRSKCRVDYFLLNKYRSSVEDFIKAGKGVTKKTGAQGFLDIVDNLEEILAGGPSECSCKRCEKIGDAIIALDAPRTFTLEHTDLSYNHLCSSLGQPHQQHPSEIEVVKKAAGTP
jgi:hypothetical protein